MYTVFLLKQMMIEFSEVVQFLMQFPLAVLPMFFWYRESLEKKSEREKVDALSQSVLNAYMENMKVATETRKSIEENTRVTHNFADKLDFLLRMNGDNKDT